MRGLQSCCLLLVLPLMLLLLLTAVDSKSFPCENGLFFDQVTMKCSSCAEFCDPRRSSRPICEDHAVECKDFIGEHPDEDERKSTTTQTPPWPTTVQTVIVLTVLTAVVVFIVSVVVLVVCYFRSPGQRLCPNCMRDANVRRISAVHPTSQVSGSKESLVIGAHGDPPTATAVVCQQQQSGPDEDSSMGQLLPASNT